MGDNQNHNASLWGKCVFLELDISLKHLADISLKHCNHLILEVWDQVEGRAGDPEFHKLAQLRDQVAYLSSFSI